MSVPSEPYVIFFASRQGNHLFLGGYVLSILGFASCPENLCGRLCIHQLIVSVLDHIFHNALLLDYCLRIVVIGGRINLSASLEATSHHKFVAVGIRSSILSSIGRFKDDVLGLILSIGVHLHRGSASHLVIGYLIWVIDYHDFRWLSVRTSHIFI